MAEGLTIDNVGEAVKHFLREMLAHPEKPVDQARGLVLCGPVGDAEMREIMDLFDGTLKITVQEPLPSLKEPVDHGPVFDWKPSEEVATR